MTWNFYFEEEGENGENSFTIQAKDYQEAFDKAFDSYGPQVYNMFYKAT